MKFTTHNRRTLRQSADKIFQRFRFQPFPDGLYYQYITLFIQIARKIPLSDTLTIKRLQQFSSAEALQKIVLPLPQCNTILSIIFLQYPTTKVLLQTRYDSPSEDQNRYPLHHQPDKILTRPKHSAEHFPSVFPARH